MYMMTVQLSAASRDRAGITGAAVHDILWAHAPPDLGLEHVRVAVEPSQLSITIFCTAPGKDQALYRAVRVCELACQESPMLRDWHVCYSC